MDPRLQERRDEVERDRRRRWRRGVGIVVAVVVLGVAALAALHSPFLSARHVVVVGAVHTDRAQLLRAGDLTGSPPLIDVSPSSSARAIDALPWVAQATVTRHWPDTIRVALTERVPVAGVPAPGGHWALVDKTGRVLAVVTGLAPSMVVLMSPAVPGRPGSVLGRAAAPGLTVAAQLPPVLVGRVHRVTVSAEGAVVLDLGGGVSAELGPVTDLAAKFESLAAVLAAAPPRAPALIDVTVPDAPTVGPPPPPPPAPHSSTGATTTTTPTTTTPTTTTTTAPPS